LDAARAGEIGGNDATDTATALLAAEQRAVVERLEGELLIVHLELGLDLGERRAGARRQHQFGRLVEGDARDAAHVERDVGLAGASYGALAAPPDDLERLVVLDRPAHR